MSKTEQQETAELVTNLTLGDLKLLVSLIDVASSRGILRANELTIIGNLYDKLNSILSSASSK